MVEKVIIVKKFKDSSIHWFSSILSRFDKSEIRLVDSFESFLWTGTTLAILRADGNEHMKWTTY